LLGSWLFVWPMFPCRACALHIIQNDVRHVRAPHTESVRWEESIGEAQELFNEAGVEWMEIGTSRDFWGVK